MRRLWRIREHRQESGAETCLPMPFTVHDHRPLREAIAASRDAMHAGDEPYGASLVSPSGELLMVARNRQHTDRDLTAHAEMVLVRQAQAALGAAALRGATVYASGEPCAMCSGALFWAGVARVVFAAPQSDLAATMGGAVLPLTARQVLTGAHPAPLVEGPALRDEALAVLREAAARRASGAR
jgi:tRNA(adenine34) deaminase